ncbi:terpene synthase family protein [Streptomyces sp. NPDC001719]
MKSNKPPIEIPPLCCPFPSALHPEVQHAQRHVSEWMAHFGLDSQAGQLEEKNKWGTVAALMFPFGEDRVTLELAADFLAWISEFDEKCVEWPAEQGHSALASQHLLRCHSIVDAPGDKLQDSNPYYLAWQDVWQRLVQIATPQQMSRMATGWTEYAAGAACEIPYLTEKRTPLLPDYLAIRRRTVAMRIWFVGFIELVGEFELPEHLWSHPALRRLNTLANDLMGCEHDIMTCQRDLQLPGAMNLTVALARHHDWPLQRAVEHAAEIYQDLTQQFTHLATKLREGADNELCTYISALEASIKGFLVWHEEITARYQISTSGTLESNATPSSL